MQKGVLQIREKNMLSRRMAKVELGTLSRREKSKNLSNRKRNASHGGVRFSGGGERAP